MGNDEVFLIAETVLFVANALSVPRRDSSRRLAQYGFVSKRLGSLLAHSSPVASQSRDRQGASPQANDRGSVRFCSASWSWLFANN